MAKNKPKGTNNDLQNIHIRLKKRPRNTNPIKKKPLVNSGAPKGKSVLAPLVAPVVLI